MSWIADDKWTHTVPTTVGLYLRLNPVSNMYQPTRMFFYEIDGELCYTSQGGTSKRLLKWGGAPYHLWYGPINPLKSEENIESPDSAVGKKAKVSLPCGEHNTDYVKCLQLMREFNLNQPNNHLKTLINFECWLSKHIT